jgi:hypothetical protein
MANAKENRVLGRRGARAVDEQELEHVNGGVRTETKCSFAPTGADGDFFLGEC